MMCFCGHLSFFQPNSKCEEHSLLYVVGGASQSGGYSYSSESYNGQTQGKPS